MQISKTQATVVEHVASRAAVADADAERREAAAAVAARMASLLAYFRVETAAVSVTIDPETFPGEQRAILAECGVWAA